MVHYIQYDHYLTGIEAGQGQEVGQGREAGLEAGQGVEVQHHQGGIEKGLEEEEAGREILESSCDVGSGCFGLVALEEPVGSPSTGTQHRCFASNGRRQRERATTGLGPPQYHHLSLARNNITELVHTYRVL